MQDLEDQAQNQRSAASSHYEELLQTRTRLDGLNSKYSELESSLASAQAANKDLRVIIASIGVLDFELVVVGRKREPSDDTTRFDVRVVLLLKRSGE